MSVTFTKLSPVSFHSLEISCNLVMFADSVHEENKSFFCIHLRSNLPSEPPYPGVS